MNTIINLMQHTATPVQIAAGVLIEVQNRAAALSYQAKLSECNAAMITTMIGGTPWLMAQLEKALWDLNIIPVYSFSVRKSIETEIDGVVTKSSVFEHVGWLEVEQPISTT